MCFSVIVSTYYVLSFKIVWLSFIFCFHERGQEGDRCADRGVHVERGPCSGCLLRGLYWCPVRNVGMCFLIVMVSRIPQCTGWHFICVLLPFKAQCECLLCG